MTLGDLEMPTSTADAARLRRYALVFTAELAARLSQMHQLYGNADSVPIPRVLADGRYMLQADILTATLPGGYLHAMWEASDKYVLNTQVEVLPYDEAVALLPSEMFGMEEPPRVTLWQSISGFFRRLLGG